MEVVSVVLQTWGPPIQPSRDYVKQHTLRVCISASEVITLILVSGIRMIIFWYSDVLGSTRYDNWLIRLVVVSQKFQLIAEKQSF